MNEADLEALADKVARKILIRLNLERTGEEDSENRLWVSTMFSNVVQEGDKFFAWVGMEECRTGPFDTRDQAMDWLVMAADRAR